MGLGVGRLLVQRLKALRTRSDCKNCYLPPFFPTQNVDPSLACGKRGFLGASYCWHFHLIGSIVRGMASAHHCRFLVWLGLLVLSSAGGWFFGRIWVGSGVPPSRGMEPMATKAASPYQNEPAFAAGSPPSLWMAGVKEATASDFPRLLEEWNTVFPEGLEGRPKGAIRWLFGTWLTKDPEGFLQAVTDPEFNYSYWAAEALVLLMPQRAAELVSGPAPGELGEYFACNVMRTLAEHNPALYLGINPDGTFEVIPGRHSSGYDDWERAIANLAKTDPPAAAKACLEWNGENAPRTINRALLAVVAAWNPGDPPITEWIKGIADLRLRNFANHARLSALAERDPQAALVELYSAGLEDDNGLDRGAPREILSQLAKADLVVALRLMRDVEGIFSRYRRDLFAEPSAEEEAEKTAFPFRHLSPGRFAGGDDVENNGVRHAVLRAAAEDLPDDPNQLFGALHQLRTDMGGGDRAWQRGVEAALIRLKSERWSADACLAAANLWAAESSEAPDDPTFQKLAARAAHVNLEQTLAALDDIPEAARPLFAAEIIKKLPATDPDQRIALFSRLTAAQWDENLGEVLGRNAGDYAPVLASLPTASTLGARRTFMEQWGEQDPEAAAQWLSSLPDDAATEPAAAGLAASWESYDEHAAAAWAATLPAGPARDGAANSLANAFARSHPEEAWQWASAVSDPETRAEAFYSVAYHWRDESPEEFRAAYAAARQAVGLPVLQHGTDLFEEDPPEMAPWDDDPFAEDPFE